VEYRGKEVGRDVDNWPILRVDHIPSSVSLEPETTRQHQGRCGPRPGDCHYQCHYHQQPSLDEFKLLDHASKRRQRVSRACRDQFTFHRCCSTRSNLLRLRYTCIVCPLPHSVGCELVRYRCMNACTFYWYLSGFWAWNEVQIAFGCFYDL
jgi:hypothetical protein